VVALCNWHLRAKNLGDEWIKYHPNKAEILDQFMWEIQNSPVPFEQLLQNIEQFKAEWGGKAAAFMESVQPEVHSIHSSTLHFFKLKTLHLKVAIHSLMLF